MAELSWTREAVEGLREIHDHIARDRPETARRTVGSLIAKLESLAAHPTPGGPWRRYDGSEVHRLRYGSFRVAYVLADDVLTVLGVFNGQIFLPPK